MKIAYVANVRMPTEKAHGVQILKTCEALVRAGATLELIVPTRLNPIQESAFAYYDMPETFPITYLKVPDTVGWGRFGFILQTMRFAHAAKKYVRAHADAETIVYGRDERALVHFLDLKLPIIWETHTGAWNGAARRVAARAKRIIAISNGLKDEYVSKGVPAAKIIVAHDAIDLQAFASVPSKQEARAALGLPQDAIIAMYIGKLTAEKGAPVFFEAAAQLKGAVGAAVIGGTEIEIAALRAAYPAVRFLGSRPYRELAAHQAAADILVLPNSGRTDVSARYTSPLKLFAAIASGVPIVATDVPSLREVLDDTMATFVPPDDASALARAIQDTAANPAAAKERAAHALAAASGYTWDIRARAILAAL